ncbi:MAG: Rha family transcriptional regulator, partial [Aeromonas sp.]
CFEINALQNGRRNKYYEISKDGLMLLVMGFTGEAAMAMKINFIAAFNWLAQQLSERQQIGAWQHEFAKREALSMANGSAHGRGLARRRVEKRALHVERLSLDARAQMALDLSREVLH